MHEEKFKTINDAYQVLGDEAVRKRYDRARAAEKEGPREEPREDGGPRAPEMDPDFAEKLDWMQEKMNESIENA